MVQQENTALEKQRKALEKHQEDMKVTYERNLEKQKEEIASQHRQDMENLQSNMRRESEERERLAREGFQQQAEMMKEQISATQQMMEDREERNRAQHAEMMMNFTKQMGEMNARSDARTAEMMKMMARQKGGGCFSGECTVELVDGSNIKMKDLRLGQSIYTLDSKGLPKATTFLGWTDRDASKPTSFLEIKTRDGSIIILTATHLIMVNSIMKFAGEVQIGDLLHSSSGHLTEVTSRAMITSTGFYCPLTMDSTILAGGLLTSCFASTSYYTNAPHKAALFHQMAHLLFMPVRFCPWILEDRTSINKVG